MRGCGALIGLLCPGVLQVAASAEPPKAPSAPKKDLQLVGPEPKRFAVAEGQLLNVSGAGGIE